VLLSTWKESPEELNIIVNMFNVVLKGDRDLGGFQLPAGQAPAAELLVDGVAMVKTLDKLLPGVVDVRAMNKSPKDNRDKIENWNLVIGSARSAGCRLTHVTAESLAQAQGGNADAALHVLLWEVIRMSLETRVKKLKVYLEGAFPKEKVADVVKFPMEKLLCQWLQGFCSTRGHQIKPQSLTNDLKDGLAYAVVLSALLKAGPSAAGLAAPERLAAVQELAQQAHLDADAGGLSRGVYWQHYILAASLLIKAGE